MSIKYKVAKIAEAGVSGGGACKYKARITNTQTISTRELSKIISSRCTVNSADVVAVITSLSEVIPELVKNGQNVKLQDFGIFSASIQSEIKDSAEEINSRNIKTVKLNFRADNFVKKELKTAEFSRTS